MMDPAKLKVVELRAELSKRGLDTKGNKPVLVERLRKALEQDTEDTPEEEAPEVISVSNSVAVAAHKNARDKTPEPATPNRTSGRSSRSTPTKATPARGHSKTVLPSIPEKQISSTKSPVAEKPAKIVEDIVTTKRDEPAKVEVKNDAVEQPHDQEDTTKASGESNVESLKAVTTSEPLPRDVSSEVTEERTPKSETTSESVSKEFSAKRDDAATESIKGEQVCVRAGDHDTVDDTCVTNQDMVEPDHQAVSGDRLVLVERPIPEEQAIVAEQVVPKEQPILEEKSVSEEQTVGKEQPVLEEQPVLKEQLGPKEPSVPEEQPGPKELSVPEEQPVLEQQPAPEQQIAPEELSVSEQPALEELSASEEQPGPEEQPVSEEQPIPEEQVQEDPPALEEKATAPDDIAKDDNALENEPMETDIGNQELSVPMDIKAENEDQENSVKMATEAIEDSSNLGGTMDANADASVKEEVDEKPNIENAVVAEEQDVEMKNVKVEEEDGLNRNVKDEDTKGIKDEDAKGIKDRKRKRSPSPQDEKRKSPPPSRSTDEPELNETDVVLSWYDSDLNLMIDRESFLSATAMHNDGFGYIWAGARASYGFTEGKIYYEAKITEYCEVNLQDEQSPHVMRVGWSIQGSSMQLGEEPFTYGFGGTGKISTGNKFSDYGAAFGKDDVIGCYLDFTSDENIVISYTINGKDMGRAFTVLKTSLEGKPLYPHVLTKNCTFVCNFGQEKPWCEILDDYMPVGAVDLKNRVPGPHRPEKKEDCEIIMMCGLPAAGKTVWATKYAENHREKMYNILGTNSLIEKMKVIGLPRKRNYPGRWEVLIDKCTRCLNKLLELASMRRRNYILDQTNVYPTAQRRKMRNFYGYHRRAVVIVPTEEEFKSRISKRAASEGEIVPDSAVLEMKANFSAPVVGETFDMVEWVELPAEEGKKLIEKYNKEGKEAGYGQQQTAKRPRFERNDNHRDNRDNRQESRQNSRDNRDNRDHRDRRNNYADRNRNSTWRGGNSGGWRDRQSRPSIGHARHGGGSGSGYGGGLSSGSWRGRGGSSGGTPSSYRPNDRRVSTSGHDRRTSGMDRNRSAPSRQGGWAPANNYQGSQQQSGSWGGSSQSGNWQGSQSQQQAWSNQAGWGQQQQSWGSWKGYGQGSNYSQGNYSQQGYGNGNWAGWNQQYYNQYWGQQQPTGQTSTAGSQAGNTSSSTAGNSSTSTSSTYGSYQSAWQGYTPSYGYSAESSNTNAQQQK